MPLHISSTRAHRQEAKIVLYNLWYLPIGGRPLHRLLISEGNSPGQRTETESKPTVHFKSSHTRGRVK